MLNRLLSRKIVGKSQQLKRATSVCFVAPNAYPLLANDSATQFIGGAEVQQVMTACGLASRGYDISMICLDFGQPDRLEINGVNLRRAYRPDDGIPVLRFVWPRLTSIWNCMKAVDADIYYYRTAGMLAGVMALFCKRNHKRSVFAAAGNPDLERDTPKIRYWRDRRIYEYGLRNVDRILVQNDEQARLCRKNFHRKPICVPNMYTSAVSSVRGRGRHILWVSTIRRIKQPQIFLEVAEALPQFRFRIVGGPDARETELYESIRSRSAKLDNIEFVGFVPYAEVGAEFDDAALLVNTSESEGFPNTFLQAWARGIPTVSFVDSGARLNGRPVGRIVANIEELIAEASFLMKNPAACESLGRECMDYVQRNHAPERILDMYEEIFASLMVHTGSGNGLRSSARLNDSDA